MQVNARHLFEPLATSSRSVTVETADLAEEPRAWFFSAFDVLGAGVPVEPTRVQPWMTVVVPLLLRIEAHFLFRCVMRSSSRIVGRSLDQFRESIDERLMLFAAVPGAFLSR